MRQKTVFDTQRDINEPFFNARYTWKPNNVVVGYAYLQDQANTGQATGFRRQLQQDCRASRRRSLSRKRSVGTCSTPPSMQNRTATREAIPASMPTTITSRSACSGKTHSCASTRRSLEAIKGLYAFQTPLGTNHLFQGWADLFLTTPRQGIRDTYVAGGAKLHKATFYGEYHWYRSDFGNIDFGPELDLAVSYPFLKSL